MCWLIRGCFDKIANSILCIAGIPSIIIFVMKMNDYSGLDDISKPVSAVPLIGTVLFGSVYYCCIRPTILCGDSEKYASQLDDKKTGQSEFV